MVRVIRDLPDFIQEQLSNLPEYRMGVHRVVAILDDGSEFHNVHVAWAREVVRVGASEDIPFDPGRVVAVRNLP